MDSHVRPSGFPGRWSSPSFGPFLMLFSVALMYCNQLEKSAEIVAKIGFILEIG